MDFDPIQPDLILLFMDAVSLFNVFAYSHIYLHLYISHILLIIDGVQFLVGEERKIQFANKFCIAPQGI